MKKLSIYSMVWALFIFSIYLLLTHNPYSVGGIVLYIGIIVIVPLILTIVFTLKKNRDWVLIINCGTGLANLCARSFPISYTEGYFYFYFPTNPYYLGCIALLLIFYLLLQYHIQKKRSIKGSIILFTTTLCAFIYLNFFP